MFVFRWILGRQNIKILQNVITCYVHVCLHFSYISGRWIGRRDTGNWSDFAVWHVSTMVYSQTINELDVQKKWVHNAPQEVCFFEREHTSVRRKARSYIDVNEGHTETPAVRITWTSHISEGAGVWPYVERKYLIILASTTQFYGL
jgi:hypothetical protein